MRSWSELLHRFKVFAICFWCRKWMKDCTAIAIALKVFIYNPLAMKMYGSHCAAVHATYHDIPWLKLTFLETFHQVLPAVHLEFDHQTIWANYNKSLTWIKAIWGWFPLLTMISSEGEQWGRDEISPEPSLVPWVPRALGSRSRRWASRARSLGSEFPAPATPRKAKSNFGPPKLVTLIIGKCRSIHVINSLRTWILRVLVMFWLSRLIIL